MPDLNSNVSIDLHRHILGAARLRTLYALAKTYDVPEAMASINTFTKNVVHTTPVDSLRAYVKPWSLFRKIIHTPKDIERISFEAATDARNDGVHYVEFRNSLPGMPITDGNSPQTRIPADEYLDAIKTGFARVKGVVSRLIVSINRHAVGGAETCDLENYAEKVLNVLNKFRDNLIVGLDLTGVERGWPASLFTNLFAELRRTELPVTIHAGETEGPGEIWTAIQVLGARRIGHGTSAPQDPLLIKELVRRGIVLEVCPTSNWLVGTTKDRQHHPVVNSQSQIPYVICTDNPTLNASKLSDELRMAASMAGADLEEFRKSQYHMALRSSFFPSSVVMPKE